MFKILKRLLSVNFSLNLLSVGGATIFANLIGLVTLGYSARVLGPSNYGLVVFGVSVSAYAGILISPGLSRWGMRAIAQDRGHTGEYLIAINLTQFALAIVGFSGLLIYAFNFLAGNERLIVLLYGLSLFITAINIDFVYSGLELMRVTALLSILSSTLNTIGLLTLVRSSDDVYRLPLLTIGISLSIQIILYFILVRKYKIIFKMPPLRSYPKIYIASLPLGLASLMMIFYTYSNNLIIKSYLGIVAVGIFYSAYRLIELASQGFQVFSYVYLPRFSNQVAVNPELGTKYALGYITILLTLAFWLAPLIFVEAPNLVGIVYGTRYQSAVEPLRIMSLVVVFMAASIGYNGTLIPFRKDHYTLGITVSTAILVISAGLLLIPRYGVIGAAWIWVFNHFFAFFITLPIFKKITGTFGFSNWYLPLLGCGTVLLSFIFFREIGLNMWLRGILEALVYIPFGYISLKPLLAVFKENLYA